MTGSLETHLAGGVTTVCRCWALTRRDGLTRGFTDHDRGLSFEGIAFRAETGMAASALMQATGLAVDNAEALGILSDDGITDAEIAEGRLDAAEVRLWLVNWSNVAERKLRFRGQIGEIRRTGGTFQAELRGLTDLLNRPLGRVYQTGCGAVLGDAACKVDLDHPSYRIEAVLTSADDAILRFEQLDGPAAGWFAHGRVIGLAGAATGLEAAIRDDRIDGSSRVVELWQPFGAKPRPGDRIALVAGCDRRAQTCRSKFANLANFRGFPHLPGDDWLMAVPRSDQINDGGSRSS